jgi:serine/threonine protein kinase
MELRDRLQGTLGGTYSLERELGGGGMSRVFVATETALGRSVVVKVLPPDLVGSVNMDRFRQEIRLAARLQHPHIVPVLAAGEVEGIPFYTMPLVEGRSLRAQLREDGALPLAEAVGVLADVAKALAYAHEHGVVHRDIKPDNVLLSGGAAMVTDFGIAKAISESTTQTTAARLTTAGTSVGTPAYMAPEQAAGDPTTDHRADIYALGCLAYELLSGAPPFAGLPPRRQLAAQIGEMPPPISRLRPDLPSRLAKLVMRCLRKDPAERPQTAAEVVRVLETVTTTDTEPAAIPAALLVPVVLGRALALYVVAAVAVVLLARAAIITIGLPEWVLPGAVIVMALGLPVVLLKARAHYASRRAVTDVPLRAPDAVRPTRNPLDG